MPPPLEALGARPFSFYPAIIGIEHNEWRYLRATWAEILVVNCRTGMEVWIPRRFLGELSRTDEPVVIVGLQKELEYKGGAVWPYQRRVIQMPVAVNESPRPAAPEPRVEPAPVIGIRLESGQDSRMGKLIGATLLVGIMTCLVVVMAYRQGTVRQRIVFTTRDQSYLELNRQDDYYSIVRKLGLPDHDRWMSETGEIQYRALTYPQRNYTVILMGTDRKQATYVGTVDKDWNPVHSVQFRAGGDTGSMLRGLKHF